LTKAAEVARYVETDPELQPKVRLEAVATFVDPTGTVFLQDDSGATFLRSSKLGRTMRTGTRLSVTGERYPGLYIGGIVPDEVKVLGESPLPAPKAVTPDDLRTGRYHYQLVEITGVGRSLRMTGENTATLLLNTPDGVVEARFDQNPPEDTHDFVDAALRVTGLAAGAINDRRQLVQPYIRVADIRAITVLQPPQADPFAQPAVPMSTLLDGSTVTPAMHRMKVKGVALSGLVGGGFFVREDSRSLFIHTPYLEPLQPGDEVEALGFPQMGTFSAMLADAVFRVTGEGEPPSPVQATGEDLRNGTCDSDLIQIEARLLQKSGNENAWLAEVEGHSFKVMGGGHDLPEMEPGALVRFTGLCRVSGVRSEGYRTYPTGYELWLRSVADVQVLTAPPWWNAPRLALALATVAGAALLAATWAALLKRQVNRQLSILQEKTQAEAVLEERQRIAREFHDTLEQELAGLSIRLDAATPRVADEKARGLLEQQRRLLSRLQTETREFVWDLRDESRQVAPLPQSLGLLLDHLQSTTSIPLRLEVHGTPPSLPPLVQHHLLRIAREAVHNAIKYARPKTVQVEITAGGDTLELSIRDDGTGFDLEVAQVRQGHFGLQGMRERAKKLATELKVESLPGKGTRVGLTLALPRLRASLA
jgi:signal transduction histidine kinase